MVKFSKTLTRTGNPKYRVSGLLRQTNAAHLLRWQRSAEQGPPNLRKFLCAGVDKQQQLPILTSGRQKGTHAMSKLVLVSREGRIMNDEKPISPSPMVEEHQQDPLHVIAAREAQRQSTKKKEAK